MLQQGFEANASDYDGRQAQLLSEKLQPLHLPNQRHCLPNCRADELEPPARLLCGVIPSKLLLHAAWQVPVPGFSMDCMAWSPHWQLPHAHRHCLKPALCCSKELHELCAKVHICPAFRHDHIHFGRFGMSHMTPSPAVGPHCTLRPARVTWRSSTSWRLLEPACPSRTPRGTLLCPRPAPAGTMPPSTFCCPGAQSEWPDQCQHSYVNVALVLPGSCTRGWGLPLPPCIVLLCHAACCRQGTSSAALGRLTCSQCMQFTMPFWLCHEVATVQDVSRCCGNELFHLLTGLRAGWARRRLSSCASASLR